MARACVTVLRGLQEFRSKAEFYSENPTAAEFAERDRPDQLRRASAAEDFDAKATYQRGNAGGVDRPACR
jgi:hypothetical protein